MYDFTRADWRARAATSVRTLDYSRVKHAIVHYPGSTAAIGTDPDTIAARLRGWQNYHMDTRGWTDLAYSVAVDQAGRIWEGRGLDRRDGATSGLGGVSMSILAMVANDEKPTDAMLSGILKVFAEAERRQPSVKRSWHSAHSSTSCPGDALRAWGQSGWPAPATGLVAVTPIPQAAATHLAVDGKLGPLTIKALQRWLGVTADGIIGPVTRKALQQRLGVTVDGIWGPKTTKALQKLVGATVDGIWGPNTTKALQTYLNNL